jgi:hypothetical protein
MQLFQDGGKKLTKLALSVILVFVGILIGVIGILTVLTFDTLEPEEVEAIRLKDTIEYVQTEQARLGVDCGMLKATLLSFVQNEIRPVLNARQSGQEWNQFISADVSDRMEELQRNYFVCGRLYRAAQNGKWEGLKDLAFAVELDKEIIILHTLVSFGEFGEQCDALCLDQRFGELQSAVKKIEVRLER